MDKRTFLRSVLLGVAGIFMISFHSALKAAKTRKKWDGIFRIPDLPYAFNALEPFMDKETMELHYSRHHAAYTEKFNEAVQQAGLTGKTAHELLKEVSRYPVAIRNNGGGYLNHKFFWRILAPASGKKPSAELSSAIVKHFGSMQAFQSSFASAALSLLGSGWVWLITDETGTLKITTTQNQDNPIMDTSKDRGMPVLCLDIWEHAYYMRYKSRRADYVDAFWNVVNWDVVSNRYRSSLKMRLQTV